MNSETYRGISSQVWKKQGSAPSAVNTEAWLKCWAALIAFMWNTIWGVTLALHSLSYLHYTEMNKWWLWPITTTREEKSPVYKEEPINGRVNNVLKSPIVRDLFDDPFLNRRRIKANINSSKTYHSKCLNREKGSNVTFGNTMKEFHKYKWMDPDSFSVLQMIVLVPTWSI